MYSVAVSLLLSSAKVERLFSHLKLAKSERLNQLLNINLNMEEEMWESIKYESEVKCARLIQRRLRFYTLVPVASLK